MAHLEQMKEICNKYCGTGGVAKFLTVYIQEGICKSVSLLMRCYIYIYMLI